MSTSLVLFDIRQIKDLSKDSLPPALFFFFKILGPCFLKQFEFMFLSVDLDIFYLVMYISLSDKRNITVLNKN